MEKPVNLIARFSSRISSTVVDVASARSCFDRLSTNGVLAHRVARGGWQRRLRGKALARSCFDRLSTNGVWAQTCFDRRRRERGSGAQIGAGERQRKQSAGPFMLRQAQHERGLGADMLRRAKARTGFERRHASTGSARTGFRRRRASTGEGANGVWAHRLARGEPKRKLRSTTPARPHSSSWLSLFPVRAELVEA